MEHPSANNLAAGLAPSIADESCAIVVAEVRQLRNVVDADGKTESGLVDLGVIEALRGKVGAGADLSVPFRRLLDPRMRMQDPFNAWSSLPLSKAARLVLGVRLSADPAFGVAISGEALGDEALLADARRCVAIRAIPRNDTDRLRDALAQGIADPSSLVAELSATVAVELPRDAALAIFEAAARRDGLERSAQERVAYGLSNYPCFQGDRWADRTNVRALEALALGLVRASAFEHRRAWLRGLQTLFAGTFSGDPARDAGIRRALLAQMQAPLPADVQAAIEKVGSPLSGSDRDAQKGRETAKQLLELWKAAR